MPMATLIGLSLIVCPLLLVVLFMGSSTMGEQISGSKYPEYARYCASVPRFLPLKKYK